MVLIELEIGQFFSDFSITCWACPGSVVQRTAWHTHPLGQILIVTSGCGWAQREGGSIEEIYPGDVVWFSPWEKHWHGATATTAMTHIAIQESLNGKAVDWLEKVTEEQYHQAK